MPASSVSDVPSVHEVLAALSGWTRGWGEKKDPCLTWPMYR